MWKFSVIELGGVIIWLVEQMKYVAKVYASLCKSTKVGN